jgi:hypothetical protein
MGLNEIEGANERAGQFSTGVLDALAQDFLTPQEFSFKLPAKIVLVCGRHTSEGAYIASRMRFLAEGRGLNIDIEEARDIKTANGGYRIELNYYLERIKPSDLNQSRGG